MTAKRFNYINYSDNLDAKLNAENFQILYKQYKDALKIIKNLEKENEELQEENTHLKLELDTHKHSLWSTREAEQKVSELTDLLSNETKKNAILLDEINSLRKENMRLKEVKKYE